jgi:glycosyltransferase involved in cell wall biosynthesis
MIFRPRIGYGRNCRQEKDMFSVIMPVYNVEKYVGAAVQSIIDQTNPNWELIAVDDASTDNSLAVLEEYEAKDERIRVVRHPQNSGIAKAYQTGLEAARYDWVVVLDSDDTAFPDRLDQYAQAIAAQPDVIAWGGHGHFINEKGRLLFITDLGPKTHEEFYQLQAAGQPLMMLHSTFAFRRDIALKVGGYHNDFLVPDIDLMDRMADHGVMLTLSAPLAYYLVRSDSVTHSRFLEQSHHFRYLWDRRAAKNRNQELTYEQYQARHKAKPILQKLGERLGDIGRMHWRRAGIAYGERNFVGLATSLLIATVCNPAQVFSKITNQLRLRFQRLSSSRQLTTIAYLTSMQGVLLCERLGDRIFL